ncbi:hypothetical protein [Terriglobus sp. ADX1]|uniref:hypothetical protein n=1 Tax=Terriglobus sp. ADX1 TaxID=2794063 RepID=UPI002FE55412
MTQTLAVQETTEAPVELIVTGKKTPAEYFVPNGLDGAIAKVREMVDAHKPDISTEKGRKAIASIARKVASSKTYLDELGKNLVSEIKVQALVIDAERKRMRDALDALKEEARRPLTEYEEREKARVKGHEDALAQIEFLASHSSSTDPIEYLQANAQQVEAFSSRDWQEFAARYSDASESALRRIGGEIDLRLKKDAEVAELERLRAAELDRQREEREKRIAQEAAERATREVEERTRRAEAIAEQAKRDAEAAVERERQRVAAEEERARQAEERREANKRHCGKINREIVECFVKLGLPETVAKNVVVAMAKGEVPHVKVAY